MTIHRVAFASLLFCALSYGGNDPLDMHQPVIPLWPNGAPGSESRAAEPEKWITHAEAVPGEEPAVDPFHRVTNIHKPTLTVFLPPADKATGAAFIVAPGGGHKYLVIDIEGQFVAQKLNSMGIAAFVMKNRLAKAQGSTYTVEGESLADTQQAIRLVRSRAKEFGVNPNRIGIMGFSAGGELAALAETRFQSPETRPDFVVLGYPGVRPANFTFPKDTPPTFLFVNNDDGLSVATAEYYVALKKAHIPAQLMIYDRGGHGFGVTGRTPEFKTLPVAKWPEHLHDWMVDMKFIAR